MVPGPFSNPALIRIVAAIHARFAQERCPGVFALEFHYGDLGQLRRIRIVHPTIEVDLVSGLTKTLAKP